MPSILPTKDATAQFAPVRSVSPTSPPSLRQNPAETTSKTVARAAPTPPTLVSGELVSEIDKEAGRIVQRVLNPDTGEILRQYPSEAELNFSRALAAAEREKRGLRV